MLDAIGRAFEPLMRLIARALAFFYDVWPSYAGSIVLLTICVMIVLTPVTIRSTKSMLAMRRLAPEMKRLQAEYRHDRQRMNEEVMALYRANNANPLGGCLPILAQSPVFIALFYVLRGMTRRTSVLGWSSGQAAATCAATPGAACDPLLASAPKQTFNPDYLRPDTQLYQDLVVSTEMRAWGFDLASTPWEVLGTSFVGGLRYLGLVLLVGALGYYQQRQISGRMSAEEQTPQARMMMRVIPIFLPIISFSLSAGLVLYYNAQSVIRIGQQAIITRRVYRPFAEEEAARKAREAAIESGEEPEPEPEPPKPPEEPQSLAVRLGLASAPDPFRHGRQRPVGGTAAKPKPIPPAARAAPQRPAREAGGGARDGRGVARRGARASRGSSPRSATARGTRAATSDTNRRSRKKDSPPPKPVPSRVTPKGAQQRRGKRYKK